MKHTLHILRNLYFDAEAFAEVTGRPSSLRGLCSIAAYELARRIRCAGYRAEFVLGTYKNQPHCWVRTKQEILDPTIMQFDAQPQIDPDWKSMRRALDDPDYVVECSGERAVQQLDGEWAGDTSFNGVWKTALKADKVDPKRRMVRA